MRSMWLVTALTAALASTLYGAEIPAESRIASVGLFKNGLAVIKRTIAIPAAGTYRLDHVPQPVHGTFWIESNARTETRATTREVEVTEPAARSVDLQRGLVGAKVTIHFSDRGIPPATGKVVKIGFAKTEKTWSRTYRRPGYYHYGRNNRPAPQNRPMERFLILETPKGRTYVRTSMIAHLHAEGAKTTVKRRTSKRVLLFTVEALKQKPSTIMITYLAKGMAWAPSYRVDISDAKTLAIAQKAVIKNELEGLKDAEIQLISGFPSVQFAHVTSPLSLSTDWANFFTQLNQRFRPGHASLSNVMSQQAVTHNVEAPGRGLDMSAIPTGEGVDLHYQPIGRHTLTEGDSLALSIASGKAPYERIVEWIVPDTRRPNGRYIREHERRQNPEKYEDAAWDAVRFKSPLTFPMTTGPAMIVANGRFNGQRLSYWVNPGEETTLHITKALSLRTRSVEHEEKGRREIVYIGGDDYRLTTVKGVLTVSNHRKETVKLVIRRRFSGELLQADGSPRSVLREEGVYSVNPRNELTWSLSLESGQEKTLTYKYSVLVDN